MTRSTRDDHPDKYVKEIRDGLKEYEAAHSKAEIEVYRYNSASVRIRIIDPDFQGYNRIAREQLVWPMLSKLSDDAQAEITLLVLLTPKETANSFANHEFENPMPSRL
jgi:stress-induced morphogen